MNVTVTYGAPDPQGPCAVCAKPVSQHGSYPTCASHPYTPDENCRHVIGARCAGAECNTKGCVRGALAVLAAAPPTEAQPVARQPLTELYLSPHTIGRTAGRTVVAELETGRIVGVLSAASLPPAEPVRMLTDETHTHGEYADGFDDGVQTGFRIFYEWVRDREPVYGKDAATWFERVKAAHAVNAGRSIPPAPAINDGEPK